MSFNGSSKSTILGVVGFLLTLPNAALRMLSIDGSTSMYTYAEGNFAEPDQREQLRQVLDHQRKKYKYSNKWKSVIFDYFLI